jgi:hypothetical protein
LRAVRAINLLAVRDVRELRTPRRFQASSRLGLPRAAAAAAQLKMPRERTGDTEMPFKDVPRNIVA